MVCSRESVIVVTDQNYLIQGQMHLSEINKFIKMKNRDNFFGFETIVMIAPNVLLNVIACDILVPVKTSGSLKTPLTRKLPPI